MKKEILLDFTSLLDVILIILFLVISSNSQTIKKEYDNEINKNKRLKEAYEELETEYAHLQEEYSEIDTILNSDDNSAGSVYDAVMNRVSHVLLKCDVSKNNTTGNPEVVINAYLSDQADTNAYIGTSKIVHDLNIKNIAKRRTYLLNQTQIVTDDLEDIVEKIDSDIIWLSIEYTYNSADISSIDLQIIHDAIDRVDRGNKQKYLYQGVIAIQ